MLDDKRSVSRVVAEARRHWHWGRTQGFGRLIEEDQLNPFERVPTAARKLWWRATHGVPAGMATPVFLVGAQRSGTNMVVRGFETSGEFEVRNENDKASFEWYRLRPDPVIKSLVEHSHHRYVLFKPLCDSHRIVELLDGLGTTMPGRAIWAYRDVDGRVRSALAKFGDVNRTVLSEIATGQGLDRWQAQGIAADTMERIRSCDWSTMSAESAAALFWYVRNRIFFDLGLDRRDDVALVSYDALVADPRSSLEPVVAMLGTRWDDRFVAHVDQRSVTVGGRERLAIDTRVRLWCEELGAQLDAVSAAQRALASAAAQD